MVLIPVEARQDVLVVSSRFARDPSTITGTQVGPFPSRAGCSLECQYCAFTGTARGQNSREFIARLVARGCPDGIQGQPTQIGQRRTR